jgi:ribonuclease Y
VGIAESEEVMTAVIAIVAALVGLLLGGLIVYLAKQRLAGRKLADAEHRAQELLSEAAIKQKEMLLEAKEEGIKTKATIEAEYRERRTELQRLERRLSQKEENLDRKLESLERREQSLTQREKAAESTRAQLEELKKKQLEQLALVSGMSTVEAKQLLLQAVEAEICDEEARRVREWETRLKEKLDEKACEILSQAIQRCATNVVAETTVSVVPLPSDEMKGRLIGREGRNIRALEQATGVEMIIDDTPEAVTLSSFDPVRREIARIALNKLILDGRIHPGRIEEMVEKAKKEVEATIRAEGERAVYESGVAGLHPELVNLLGRLKYRTSYGQNVLLHSLEVAHLSALIAAEIGANVGQARKAGLLHDLGKAVDHQVEGTHAQIGADLVKQWERSPELSQAIAEHHGEAPTTSALSAIVATADAISGARPGARGETLEQYLKRLEALESLANSFPGVDKCFAIQAGREVRVLVNPQEMDDLAAMRLARDIAKKIEETLTYPGQIKVNVIRETRATEYAK